MELRSSSRIRADQDHDNWSSIPSEILCLIAGKIVSAADFVSFVTVCRAWHSLAGDFRRLRFGPLYISGAVPEARRVTLRDPASGTAMALDMPEAAGSLCWGSPFGWIVTYEHPTRRLNLLNPLSGATIGLPDLPRSRSGGRRWGQLKAFLTADPDSDPDNCLVIIAAWYRKLAFVRPRGRLVNKASEASRKQYKVWSTIHGDVYLIDITSCNGNVYGLGYSTSSRLQIFQFEPRKQNPRFVHILDLNLNPPEHNHHPIRVDRGHFIDHIRFERQLVDLNGELCLCIRTFNSSTTVDVKLYTIDPSARAGGLTKVLSLGDRCLFLGNGYSFSCKASYPPGGFFEQCGSKTSEFVSNYVFYAHNREWAEPWFWPDDTVTFDKRPFDVEVWDMLSSTKVYGRKDSPTPALYGPLWIIPSIK